MSSNRIKKKSFILLELLIAFSLVSFSIVPFIRFPLHHIKKETDFLFQMELERIANNSLCNLMEKIFRKELSEEVLFTKKKTLIFEEPEKEMEICFPKVAKRQYFWEKFIQCSSVKTNGNKQAVLVSLIVNIYKTKKSHRQTEEKKLVHAVQKLIVLRKSTGINPTPVAEENIQENL